MIAYDADHEVGGVARLVIAEIKKPGVTIGSEQKEQAWKYVKELLEKGLITKATKVSCFVLGSIIDPVENDSTFYAGGAVEVRPLAYDVFVKRAEARMLSLNKRLQDAPFLKEKGIDGAAFVTPPIPQQSTLNFHEPRGHA